MWGFIFSADKLTIAKNLDQAQQNIGPDLDPELFDTDGIPERFFLKS